MKATAANFFLIPASNCPVPFHLLVYKNAPSSPSHSPQLPAPIVPPGRRNSSPEPQHSMPCFAISGQLRHPLTPSSSSLGSPHLGAHPEPFLVCCCAGDASGASSTELAGVHTALPVLLASSGRLGPREPAAWWGGDLHVAERRRNLPDANTAVFRNSSATATPLPAKPR